MRRTVDESISISVDSGRTGQGKKEQNIIDDILKLKINTVYT